MPIINSNDAIGNRTCDLPDCSAVPQTTKLPRAPYATDKLVICYRRFRTLYRSHLLGSGYPRNEFWPLKMGQLRCVETSFTNHRYMLRTVDYLLAEDNGTSTSQSISQHFNKIEIIRWIKRDQLDVTCFIISLSNDRHVSDVNTSILRSLRLIWWVISWVVLFWLGVCWCYVVVWLGWCGIRMQAEAWILIK